MADPQETNPWVEAMRWVSTITSCSLEVVLPAGAGYWLDRKLGTLPWLTVTGLALGCVAGSYHFYLAIKAESDRSKRGE